MDTWMPEFKKWYGKKRSPLKYYAVKAFLGCYSEKGSISFTRGSLALTQELSPPYSVTSAKGLTSNDT